MTVYDLCLVTVDPDGAPETILDSARGIYRDAEAARVGAGAKFAAQIAAAEEDGEEVAVLLSAPFGHRA